MVGEYGECGCINREAGERVEAGDFQSWLDAAIDCG